MISLTRRGCLALPLLAITSEARAQPTADTLRISWRGVISNLDPYANQSRAGFVIAHEVWDTLVYRNPNDFKIEPLLATSWAWDDDRALTFALRAGVVWHNGDPFSAEDVVYTINTLASDRRLSAPAIYNWLEGADVVDTLRVRIRLKRPTPAALEYFAMTIWIWPKAYRERVGREGFARAPIGSGPYRVTRDRGAQSDAIARVELVRFDRYYVGSPKGRPAIARIVARTGTRCDDRGRGSSGRERRLDLEIRP